jgi:hypothetical protein
MRTSKVNFTVLVNDKEYTCYREISGTRVFYQHVVVESVGEEKDGMAYDHSNKVAMESVARMIAKGIIRKDKR